jgi:sec-independent protein translocase protein TatB
MFDLSWSHIAILVVVALLVLGPKELPNAIRTGAQLLRSGRKLAGEFRSGMDDLLREAELEETRKAITQAVSEGVEKTIAENVDPTGEVKAAISTDPLKELEATATAADGTPGDSAPEVIEHDAPPAPAHSILPPGDAAPRLSPEALPAGVTPAEEAPAAESPAGESPAGEPPIGEPSKSSAGPGPAEAASEMDRPDQKQSAGG